MMTGGLAFPLVGYNELCVPSFYVGILLMFLIYAGNEGGKDTVVLRRAY